MSDAPGAAPQADAVILAGGTIKNPDFRQAVGVDCRALVSILGRPMVVWVAEALKASRTINRVVVMGRPALRDTAVAGIADAIVEEGVDEVDNLFRGIAALPGAQHVLLVSADLPLLTPEAIDDFIEGAPTDAEVVFPVCERADIERDFPGRKWVFVGTPEGHYTGSSCFLFHPEPVVEHREWVQRVFDARRSVWKLITMWGKRFTLKALFHQVRLEDAAARVSELLGIRGGVYVTHFTELCMDVDKASDVAFVEERLQQREK